MSNHECPNCLALVQSLVWNSDANEYWCHRCMGPGYKQDAKELKKSGQSPMQKVIPSGALDSDG